ncbi:MAG: extensin family protein [Pseudomonadota bacterium]|nr:extensin family protein [Pseudomonadota bacterium]
MSSFLGRLPLDRIALVLLALVCLVAAGLAWLADHPEHDPRAPLTLDQPEGWATGLKLAALRDDPRACAAFLERSAIVPEILPATGDGACRRADRQQLASVSALGFGLRPSTAQATCAVDAAFARWLRHGIEPAARAHLGQGVDRIEHMGTYNCRRIGGGEEGNWSEHATGNAIDIAGFVLEDGTRVTVLDDWEEESGGKAAFLHAVRDAACGPFATVLSPDYNAAHANHLHLDQARRTMGATACR